MGGLAAGGALASLPGGLWAAGGRDAPATATGTPPVLRGPQIDLVIASTRVNFTGAPRTATTINGSIPAPTLHLRQGEEVTIRVTNRLPVLSSIHWHGILLPFQMDGVPGISFRGIAPGETFVYRFRLRQSGTYWYHSHSAFQEMTGMYGAMVVQPRDGERIRADRDYVVQLSDWTDARPMSLLRKLKIESDAFHLHQPTFAGLLRDASALGLGGALAKRGMWNRMRMNPTDLADLSSAALTYLLNGTTPERGWTGVFAPGETVRLRCINAASNTFYDLRIPGLKLQVVQADGQDLEPVSVDELRFGPGETYDLLVRPQDDAHTIFAQSMDRTGYAFGTLAVRPGLRAPVPELDPPQWLQMTDMMGGMVHGEGGHGAHMGHEGQGGHSMHRNHAGQGGHKGHADHASHKGHAGQMGGPGLSRPSRKVRHARTEYGPSVDMRVDHPRVNLDDPGIGLRDNGRRVLTLADLRSLSGVLDDGRVPGREIELHLTGNMERYTWSFDGLEFGQSTPVSTRQGERLRVILHNDTMMTHPMHLHGMWSDLEDTDGRLLARRHTIPVQPAQRISFLTTPHDLGRWAWHCHLLFHMDMGMFREVVVS